MKICFINPTIEMRRSVAELARNLAERGHEIGLVWPRLHKKGFDMSRHFTSMLMHDNIKIIDFPCFQVSKIFYSWPIPKKGSYVKKIKQILREYDVVHMWTYFYIINVTPLILRRFKEYRAKVVMTSDTFPGFSFKDPSLIANYTLVVYAKLFGRFLFNSCDKVLVYGKSMIKPAKKAGVRRKKLKILPIGIYTNKFIVKDKNKIKKVRNEFYVRPSTAMILFAGLLNPRKGIDKVIIVTKDLLDKGLKVMTIVAGEGLKKKYKDMAKTYGVGNSVVFPGRRKDIPVLMNAADVVILPTRGEGLPGVVMEAASASTPAVASNTPCIPDLVIDGVSGYLCNMDNATEFTEKIEYLVKHPTTRKRFGKAANKHIKTYDWKVLIKKYEKFYKNIIKG